MAQNEKFIDGDELEETVPVGTLSGDPVMIGDRPGYATTDRDANGKASVKFKGVIITSVKGENNAGNAAIADGAIVYYEAAATPKLNIDNVAGKRYGYLRGAVTAGATVTNAQVVVGY